MIRSPDLGVDRTLLLRYYGIVDFFNLFVRISQLYFTFNYERMSLGWVTLDAWCGILGCGGVGPGYAVDLAGTSAVVAQSQYLLLRTKMIELSTATEGETAP
jgi:hypothetical protein